MLSKRNEKGFTLIEIIAVLVILGILAAVAVPKYMDMQQQAKDSAIKGALAEGISTVNMAFGKLMLSTGGTATTGQIAAKATANKPAGTDFSYAFSPNSIGVKISVGAKAGGAADGGNATSKIWTKP